MPVEYPVGESVNHPWTNEIAIKWVKMHEYSKVSSFFLNATFSQPYDFLQIAYFYKKMKNCLGG